MKTFKTPKGTELPLLDLRGKDYLQVAHRIVWFREEKPLWRIQTDIHFTDNTQSVVRASILDESGNIMAQGTKSETAKGFADHLEKAETGSIGRALALCGYGTQFAPEFDEGERLADSPLHSVKAPVRDFNLNISSPPSHGAQAILANPDFVLKFGKFLGMSLRTINEKALDNWIQYLKKQPKISDSAQEAIVRGEAYLNSIGFDRDKK
jgi:hypothetical protein